MDKDHYRLGYRPDVEGLRAIAVLLVIFCHAKIPGFRGGFIGVDAFFVLSGYLISGLLINEFSSNGRLDFIKFYTRRLQRLAPALFVMLLITSVIAYNTITPSEQASHYLAAATAASWLSNFHFSMSELDYFSAGSAENLFLHTWSLSLEEQFYLLWPGVIYLLLKKYKKNGKPNWIVKTGWALLLLAAISFATSFYLSYNNAIEAYYLPISRAWQFLAGALALLYTFKLRNDFTGISRVSQNDKSKVMDGAGWLGIGLLLLSATTIDENSKYPGVWGLVPTLGTALTLIAGTTGGQWSISRVLALRPLVLIGNLSYSWYLWHWPVLALAKILNPAASPQFIAIAIATSFALAGLSYHLIESPIRQSQYLASSPRKFGLATVLVMMMVVLSQFGLLEKSQRNIGSLELED